MQRFFDHIYLSPHLDDVALSCAGQISQLTASGQSCLIVTAMAGEAPRTGGRFVDLLHARWQLDESAVAARRAEDIAACRLLGSSYLHGSVPDCIYRQDPVSAQLLYTSEESLFGPIAPADTLATEQIRSMLRSLPAHGRLIAPLGVGNHVDHQLVSLAARNLGTAELSYYEEFPYVRSNRESSASLANELGLTPQTIILSPEALQARVEAISCYKSQLSTFFDNLDDLRQQVGASVEAVGGERIWREDQPDRSLRQEVQLPRP